MWQGYGGDDYKSQRVLWSSWVWFKTKGYGVDYMGNNYVLENKGVKDEKYNSRQCKKHNVAGRHMIVF